MPLPNVSAALGPWSDTYAVKTVTRTTVDFVEQQSVATRTITAVIQPADPNRLRAESIDWSLRYIRIHSRDPVAVGEYVTFEDVDYKLISVTDWQRYGYVAAVGEETRRPLL